MELKEIEQIWNCCHCNDEYFSEETYKVFCSLCDKAKYILWEEMLDPTKHFIQCYGLDEVLTELTPIEQILYLAFKIFNYNICEEFPIIFDFSTQAHISASKNSYRVDFLITKMIICNTEYNCEKRIIIECDGYESHHTKSQRNHDIERENNLKMAGYSIIRFSGTQIFNNPYDCVMRTFKFLIDENREVIRRAREDYNTKNKNKENTNG